MTTGAGNDLEKASDLARKMICEWGMSEKLGPLTFGKKEEQIFLGREFAQHRDYSEKTAQLIDTEVSALVNNSHKQALDLLQRNIEVLHSLAQILLEKETLDSAEINEIVAPAVERELGAVEEARESMETE